MTPSSLYKPDPVQLPPHPDAGLVPPILVDRVRYNDSFPWPAGGDGDGKSLQRIASTQYGNDPINWKTDLPTAGGINGFPPVIVNPPQSQFVYAGNQVTLGSENLASGSAPLRYQWRFNNIEIPGATNPTLTIASFAPKNVGNYTVIVGNFVETIVSAPARLSGDFVIPVVTITNPPNNARVTSEIITVRGRGIDVGGVTNVQLLVNDAEFVLATGTTSWFADVALVPGTNTIQAFATDVGLNSSLPATIKVFYAVPTPLTLNITDGGTVTGVANGQLLDYSGTYTAVARPNAGYMFAGWTGDVTSSNPTLRFVMQSNMVLNANFIPNPFRPVKGLYHGLFYVEGAITPTNAGFFRLTLNDTGLFSGNLILGKVTNKFSGQFGVSTLRSLVRIPRTGRTPLDLDLTLTGLGEVVGTVTDGSWTAGVQSFLTGAFPELAPFAGRYTWLIPGAENSSSTPGGDGAGTAVAAANGSVKFTGTLGDGTAVSHTANLSRQGDYPLHVVLHGGQGILIGFVNFYTNIVMSNAVTWIRPPIPASKFYPAGFGGEHVLYGSRYVKPPTTQNSLNWSNGVVLIGAGNLNQTISNRVQVIRNVVTVLDGNTNRIKLAISTTNGTFSGSFRNPLTRKTNTFTGSLLQLAHLGGGRFTGTNQTGFVSLEPVQPAVSITAPLDGLVVDACANVVITANAVVNSAQSIARVEFFANGLPLGSDDTAPYEYIHAPTSIGAQSLTAVAVDNLGSRSAPASVTVLARNHAPAFTAGINEVVVAENSGFYSDAWASNIDDGESCFGQNVTFILNNTNPALFAVQPSIDVAGTLSFTLADGVNGSAMVTVTLQDDGGIANGGTDSVSTSFNIVVTPAPPPSPN